MKIKTRHKMLIAKCLRWPFITSRKCLNLSPKVRVKRNGINWLLDFDEGVDLAIFLFGSFEPATTAALTRHVKPGDTTLDIGANIGSHMLTLAKLVGSTGSVIAFEPTVFAVEKATANLQLNPDLVPRVKIEQILLTESGDSTIPDALYSSWPLVDQGEIHAKHCGAQKSTDGARAIDLDGYLDAAGIQKVNLIKMDVDGYECKVLNGAKRLLKRCKPIMVFELCPYLLEEGGGSLEEMLEILREADYQLFDEQTEAPLPVTSSELGRFVDDGHSINIIAR